MATYEVDRGRVDGRDLDVQVSYAIEILLQLSTGSLWAPLVGPGSEFTVFVGACGRVIGFSGGWPTHLPDPKAESLVGIEVAYPQIFGDGWNPEKARHVGFGYSRIALDGGAFGLFPAYVIEPKLEEPDGVSPGVAVVPGTQRAIDALRRQLVCTVPGRRAEHIGFRSRVYLGAGDTYSDQNACNFARVLDGAGWDTERAPTEGMERDWNEGRLCGIETCDLAYYVGHASAWRVRLEKPDALYFSVADLQEQPHRRPGIWGSGDLKWLALSACGPLQDSVLTPSLGSPHDALERWRVAFGGLRMLLGNSCEIFQSIDGGARFARYATSGTTILRSWLRAAVEMHSFEGAHPVGPRYASVLYAFCERASSPCEDVLPPHGRIGPSAGWPDTYVLLSTTT